MSASSEGKIKAPSRIGRYDVERALGQGGMGCVVLARDSVLGRRVAVKYLRDDLDLPPQSKAALLTRMRHEAQAAASVSHPNIVMLHDMGEDPVVGLYLVFEYVEGPTLRARIAEGPLPLSEVAPIARALGAALTAGHAAGVIHRDVKPENVLLSKTGPKIADFGVAHVPDSMITQRNVVLGTPAYTAPEALSTADYGPASDQFSFAATLYEALAGARAFPGNDAIDVVGKIANDDPKPLEGLDADPRIVGRINGVLRRGLAKEKIERYATAEDFGAAIAIAIESRVITEAPPASSRTPSRPGARCRRCERPSQARWRLRRPFVRRSSSARRRTARRTSSRRSAFSSSSASSCSGVTTTTTARRKKRRALPRLRRAHRPTRRRPTQRTT
jgi:serine/threonine-protein kinase